MHAGKVMSCDYVRHPAIFECSTGKTQPSVIGFKNLLLCQLVASGRTCFALSVTDNSQSNRVRVVVNRSESVQKRASQLAPFIDGAGGFYYQPSASLIRTRGLKDGSTWSHVRVDATRKTEMLEEALHAIFVLRHVWVDFAVNAFEVEVGNEARRTVPGSGDN
jgi:hypothetical protein